MIQKGYYKFNDTIAPFPPTSTDNFLFYSNDEDWSSISIDALANIIEYNADVVYVNDEWVSEYQRIYIPQDVNLSASLETLLETQAYFNFKVTYNANGTLTYLNNVTELPSVLPTPQFQGYTFKGWFYDNAFTQEAHPNDLITDDVTLYAKFNIESFTLNLYQNTAEANKVDKSSNLTLITSLNGTFKNAQNLQNLSVMIETDIVPNYNYCYIVQLNKYYFITDVIMNGLRKFTLTLKEDVLYTFKDTILLQNAIIDRQENVYNNYLVDNEAISENTSTIDVLTATIPVGALYKKDVNPVDMTQDDAYIVLVTTR